MAFQPFRFLGLPRALREMVYDRIHLFRYHYTISDPTARENPGTITLVTFTIAKSILATCRTIYDEARDCFLDRRFQLGCQQGTRLIIDYKALSVFSQAKGRHDQSVFELVANRYPDIVFANPNKIVWPPYILKGYHFGMMVPQYWRIREFVNKTAIALLYRDRLIVAIRICPADTLRPDFAAYVADALSGIEFRFGAIEDGTISFVYKSVLPWTEQGTAYADFDALHATLQTLSADTFGDIYVPVRLLTEDI
jgi:hypothetical protein